MTDHLQPVATWDEGAPHYDAALDGHGRTVEVDETVACLERLADDRPILEFAIGTGRIGLPFAATGAEIHGIEYSPGMLAELRAKPGGAELPVVLGDMASTRIDGEFGLVYLVFNTVTNLLTQDAQVRCFQNAADHLGPGGRFVIEVHIPQIRRVMPGERHAVFDATGNHTGIDEYDFVNQTLTSHHTWVDGERARTFASTHRYAWPAEYDLMARIAGMELEHRWADWSGAPFDADSERHVSVWRRPD